MSYKGKENSRLVTLDCEKFNCEKDDVDDTRLVDQTVKKCSSVAVEKERNLEDGEIVDVDEKNCVERYACEFFQRGLCRVGEKCPFMHVTDKGLYRMFPLTFRNVLPVTPPPLGISSEPRETPTDWDKTLEEAKKRVDTVESDDEVTVTKSHCQKHQNRKVSSLSDSGSPKQKFDQNDWQNEIQWQNSRRRCLVCRRRKKSNSISSVNYSCSNCSFHSFRCCEVCSESRHETISCRSSSSSCSTTSIRHRFRKKRFKSQAAKQEKKHIPSVKKKPKRNSKRNDSTKGSSLISLPDIDEEENDSTKKKKSSFHLCDRNSKGHDSIKLKSAFNLPVRSRKKNDLSRESSSFSLLDRRRLKVRSRHEAISRRSPSSTSSTSSSVLHFRKEKTGKDKSARQKRKMSPSVENRPDRSSKRHDSTEERSLISLSDKYKRENDSIQTLCSFDLPDRNSKGPNSVKLRINLLDRNENEHDSTKARSLASFSSRHRHNDEIPKKYGPPTPPLQSCSDMSISPSTDSSLSDLFNPEERTGSMHRPSPHKASSSFASETRLACQAPIHFKEIQSAGQSLPEEKSNLKQIIETQGSMTKNETIVSSRSDQLKKRKFTTALENDLLKFQTRRRPKFGASRLTPSKTVQPETKEDKMPQEAPNQQKSTEEKRNEMAELAPAHQKATANAKGPSDKNKILKEMLLKQLDEINAAIERKKLKD